MQVLSIILNYHDMMMIYNIVRISTPDNKLFNTKSFQQTMLWNYLCVKLKSITCGIKQAYICTFFQYMLLVLSIYNWICAQNTNFSNTFPLKTIFCTFIEIIFYFVVSQLLCCEKSSQPTIRDCTKCSSKILNIHLLKKLLHNL